MKKNILLLFLLNSIFIYSQNDCSDALIVCGNSGYQDLTATGVGIQELSGSNTCGSQENNSLWFRISINTGGTLGFILTPTFADGSTNTDLVIDFDFFVFGPNVDCGDIGQAIRCSTTNPQASVATSNLTGMNSTEQDTSEGPGTLGNNFVRELDVIADDSYFIVIDRPVGTSNFKIDWTGTATFNDPPSATPLTTGESYDLLLCDSDGVKDNRTTFDLTSNENSILNGQPNTSISYHTSNNDALTNSSPIPNPLNYENTAAPQNIFIRLTDTNTLCFTTTKFNINAYTTPEIDLQPDNLIIEDPDNNGSEIVDLTVQDASILGAQDISEFEIMYATDITFNTIITDPLNHTSAVSLETIYFRIVNQNNITCFSQGSFTVTLVNNQPPELTANNRVAYCPLSQVNIAPNFTISDPDDAGIDAFFIQISSGYNIATDQLILTGTHPTINTSWNTNEGKLTLTPIGPNQISHTDLEIAVRDLIFESTNADISSDRFFSFTIGDANYLPLTGHFYVFVENINISWSQAKILAEASNYYGLQGYLATILSTEESQIAAEQISGAGWIGGSDEDQESVWKWVTGPEAGTIFWNGTFTGSAPIDQTTGLPMYSNWNTEEPNQAGNEDYAHITDDSIGIEGSWNDLPDTGGGGPYQAKGYIVEYGGMPGDPVLQISASTSIYIPKVLTISADIDLCTGTSVNLIATVTEGTIFWYDALGNLVNVGNSFTTPVLNSSITYYATASPEGCSISDKLAVVVTVYALPVANKPDNIERCDDDGNGFSTFDFDTDSTPKILNGQPDADFEVLYFNSLEEAQKNIPDTNIDSPYENKDAFTLETIYARIQNTNNTTCFDITSFTLAVFDLPIPIQPESYRICDNEESGSDTDAIINTFLLHTRDSEILGALDPNQYNISYHTSQNGAETNDSSTAIDKDADHSVTNTQTVFIRVANKDNSACDDASKTLDLIVDSLPEVTDVVNLLQCDDDLDRISTVNLTEAEISISANYQTETFTYFATQADAIVGSPEVTDKLRYPVNQIGEAWVRTISTEGCYRISKINLQVEAASDVAYDKEFDAVCDDFLQADGTNGPLNDDTDGITNFDFSAAESEILVFFPPALRPDLEVSYYETKEDRTAVINKITDISNYRNIEYPSDITRQTIYFKITNKNNNDCSGTGELYLKTNTVPVANSVDDLEFCDDANDGDRTNGFVQSFDLESQNNIILGNQNSSDFTVTYHLSDTDANSGNAPLSSPYTNTNRDLQTIYVRVTNNTTGCFTDHTAFNLIVHPSPIANFVEDLEVCDDNSDGSARNGFSKTIDLESQTAGILETQDNTIYKVTYHRNLIEAQNGANPLNSPFSNTTANRQTIYVRVFNADTQCANGISNFDVIINPEPTFETISNLSECDNNDDFDDANGIIQTIDLDGKIAEILGTSQDPDDFNVTFHSSKANATSGNSAISSPYENLFATETIFVRIQNKRTGCVNDDAFFDVIVNLLPDFTVTTPQILCLNNMPLNIKVENPRGVYTYEWKNTNGTTLNTVSADNINITVKGTYTVTATTTNGTSCSRTETIVINESNIAILDISFITIVDETNNIGSQNNLSISIDILSNDLGPGDYQFAIINMDDNTRTPFAGFQDEPLFENLEGGIYKILVNDKNGCSPDTTLLVSVIQFPKFFTPNADGDNDYWVVKGANKTFYPNSSINIFNRYGKLVAQIAIDGQGWDGTYGGKRLSSDDYWYNITLIPADTAKPTISKKGNFSLIRK
ncbi:hypothetical protein BST83_03565 [Polaribacter filamentus]|uniref:C-type lectin domain-containing protein n=1 Tax=Polaribacter filamentus TaxID=53483 RepID=A0A2S7KUR1_9FLAO|nr:T9SS type B sorting domain-containing protein [Polaribacter filamentus]PQB06357.1 hypothetical protein BST83_03565 [Polaribacter filamentus]